MKERINRKNAERVFLIVLLIAMMMLFLTACTNDKDTAATQAATEAPTEAPTEEPTEAPAEAPTALQTTDEPMEEEEIITSTPEPVYVEKNHFAFTISGEMAETVFCREHADDPENVIELYTVLNDQEYILFTVLFNQKEGDIVHMISDADGNRIPVAFVMNVLPADIEEEIAGEFYMAQSFVNQIIETIQTK